MGEMADLYDQYLNQREAVWDAEHKELVWDNSPINEDDFIKWLCGPPSTPEEDERERLAQGEWFNDIPQADKDAWAARQE